MENTGTGMIPAEKYREVYLRGRPVHGPKDPFSLRHPPMGASRWAKIYAPFEALAGLDAALSSAEDPCTCRREISETEKARIGALLRSLLPLLSSRENAPVLLRVLHFVPCGDVNLGHYRETCGPLRQLGAGTVRVGERLILIENIAEVYHVSQLLY